MTKMKISWVLPIYNESSILPLLYKELEKLAKALSTSYDAEFIFVNDGSKDNSIDLLVDLQTHDSRVKVIDLSRNFGHQIAISAGLDATTGDAVIFMDSDLQDPPSVCLDLIKEWEKGVDVVYAKRRTRKDSVMKRLTAYVFYRMLNRFSDIVIPEDTGDFRLISRQVAEVLKSFPERHRFVRGIISYIGFTQKPVLFDREDRKAGKSGYSLSKMVKLAEDALTGFSLAPIFMVGIAGTLLAIAGIFVSIIGLLYANILISGLGFCTALSGILMISMATIGQYTGRTYQEAQRRPLYIVRKVYESKHE